MRVQKYLYESPTHEQVKRYYSVYGMAYCNSYAFTYESVRDKQKPIEYKKEKAKKVVIYTFERN